MGASKTEVEFRAIITRVITSDIRALPYEEFCGFVENITERLLVDDAAIDPVVSGQADTGELEIRFGIKAPPRSGTAQAETDRVVERLVDAMDVTMHHDPASWPRSRDGIVLMPESTRLSDITADVAA